jgi:hypothetical protein
LINLIENIVDSYKKQPVRTKEIILPVPIVIALYAMHTLLPSFASARAITFMHFNLVMAVITLDLMLYNMAAKPFMALNPALLLLFVPLVAYFGFRVSPQIEIYISMGCAALAFFIYAMRMTIIAIQYFDYS